MLNYSPSTKSITSTPGGYQPGGLQIRDVGVFLGDGMKQMRCMLYEPVLPVQCSQIGVVAIHSDNDYSAFPIGGELAKRGFRTLCGQVTDAGSTLDAKMLDIKHAVDFLHTYPGITKVVLMGHSGGATLMTAYQAAAENGPAIFQKDNFLIKCSIQEPLPSADGLMMLDANWGNGAMTLFSIDPAIVEEGCGFKSNPELDMFNPDNGFHLEGSSYSEEFLEKFYAAQRDRNNAIVQRALDRLHALEQGKGYYVDDEPFVATAASQFGPCNKVFPSDIRLLSRTKEEYPLLHKDGSATRGVVRCLRRPRPDRPISSSIKACAVTTVRSYLTNRAVMAGSDYGVGPDGVVGIQWENTYNCPPGNIRFVSAPLLVMGMTGSYEYLASEAVYQNAASQDKSIAFVEGAGHNFDNQGNEKYGDTQKVVFDHVAQWLSQPGRFLP